MVTVSLMLVGDLQKLNPQEQQLFAKYGKLPTHKSVLMKMQKVWRIYLPPTYSPDKLV
jgi:hypothetical protein